MVVSSMAAIKQKISSVLFRTGITSALVRMENLMPMGEKNSFRILNYHRVNDFNDPFTIDSVAVSDFAAQMRFISKHYHVFPLGDIYDIITKGGKLPGRCLAITFDDGYADNHTFAYPVLKRHHLPATIFLTAGCIDARIPLWFDQVLSAFKTSGMQRFCCPFTQTVSDIQEPPQRLSTAHITLEHLKKAGNDKRKNMIPLILSELGVSNHTTLLKRFDLLTWAQISEMSKSNINFGSHTMTHPILANLSDSDLEWELAASKNAIESQLGKEVTFFAYPNGKASDYNEKVTVAVKNSGYKAALTTIPEVNTPVSDPFVWGRYRPWQNKVESFSLALLMHGLKNSGEY